MLFGRRRRQWKRRCVERRKEGFGCVLLFFFPPPFSMELCAALGCYHCTRLHSLYVYERSIGFPPVICARVTWRRSRHGKALWLTAVSVVEEFSVTVGRRYSRRPYQLSPVHSRLFSTLPSFFIPTFYTHNGCICCCFFFPRKILLLFAIFLLFYSYTVADSRASNLYRFFFFLLPIS